MPSGSDSLDAWFWSPQPLREIAQAIGAVVHVDKMSGDVENVYEWVEVPLRHRDGTINLSRQHCPDGPDEQDRVTVLLRLGADERADGHVLEVGQAIADALVVDVHVGSVEYLHGDTYDYCTELRLVPSTDP